MKEVITIDNFFTDIVTKERRDVKYQDQLTEEFKENAKILLFRVNNLLNELGIDSGTTSSGWRPPEINANTPNAAKKSAHMECKAIDILDDKDQTLAKLIQSKPELLQKYQLWMENPESTKGKNTNWCHLDFKDRPEHTDHIRIFKV